MNMFLNYDFQKHFQDTVEKTKISYNIDGPEGSLDAMMQVVACDKVCIILSYVIVSLCSIFT